MGHSIFWGFEFRVLLFFWVVEICSWTSIPVKEMLVCPPGGTGTIREIYSEDADDGTRTRNPSVINRVLELNSSKAIALKELSLYVYHFSTVVDFSSEDQCISLLYTLRNAFLSY